MSRILLIEDDKYLAEDLEFLIIDDGHECMTIFGPDDFFKIAKSLNQYDCIVLDIMMMRENSFVDKDTKFETGELIYKEIRARCPSMKMIIISAMEYYDMTIDFYKEDFVYVIDKPLNEDVINKLLLKIR